MGGGSEAVFDLHCPDGPAELRENYGFSRQELTGISARLAHVIEALCREWSRIHGRS
jgi:hypothetical protein